MPRVSYTVYRYPSGKTMVGIHIDPLPSINLAELQHVIAKLQEAEKEMKS